ncbi:MAG: LysR family transcriptional regulator [Clostridiales bacterium]|nr:LysR family transcriptional regulator [Clostridiales bacterium]
MDEFVVLAETGNYFTASNRLYLSQVTLTKHMKDLERSVGHPLLVKKGHKLELTEFGEFFLPYARRFVGLNEEFLEAKAAFERAAARQVYIAGPTEMNCDHMMNMLWDHFSRRYPQYSLSTGEFHTTLPLEDLFGMGYELVFALSETPDSDLYGCYQWATDQLVALLPTQHPLAGRDSIQLSELADAPFILFPKGNFLHQAALRRCKAAGFTPQVDFTIHGSANLTELVASNVGVSLALKRDVYSTWDYEVVTVPLEEESTIYLNLYYQKDVPLSRAAKTFLDYAIQIHETHERDIPYYGPEVGAVENIFFE